MITFHFIAVKLTAYIFFFSLCYNLRLLSAAQLSSKLSNPFPFLNDEKSLSNAKVADQLKFRPSRVFRILAHRTTTPKRSAGNYIEYQPCDKIYTDVTPCEDAVRSRRFDRTHLIFRERHCPAPEELLQCLVPPPIGYKSPLPWPLSLSETWFVNVPNKYLLHNKQRQNWIHYNESTQRFIFPGGGTQFVTGVEHYIKILNGYIPLLNGSIRTALDIGCGVASWGGFLLDKGILTMSIAPRDFFESQIQFALERGIPSMLAVMASKRLPFPARSFDLIHCSQCNVPWTEEEGLYLLEVDRLLRPGGYFLVAGPPTNSHHHCKNWFESLSACKAEYESMEKLIRIRLCWKRVADWKKGQVWRKPIRTKCFGHAKAKSFPLCSLDDNPDDAWYTDMKLCVSREPDLIDDHLPMKEEEEDQVVENKKKRRNNGKQNDPSSPNNLSNHKGREREREKEISPFDDEYPLAKWPQRLHESPPRILYDLVSSISTDSLMEDQRRWDGRVSFYKLHVLPFLNQGKYRNIMDMNAGVGGFAASLVNDPLWVMNVVLPFDEKQHLGIIFERGLIGTYHDWCESFSTYPRTYDFVHAYHVFSQIETRCSFDTVLLEMDRILRPEGAVIIRDKVKILELIEQKIKGMRWEGRILDTAKEENSDDKILVCMKKYWTS